MAIKVIIERRIQKGKDAELAALMRETRAKAMLAKGYISGETLRAHDDSSLYVIISTWKSLEEWNVWARSPERTEIMNKMEILLEGRSTVRVFDFA